MLLTTLMVLTVSVFSVDKGALVARLLHNDFILFHKCIVYLTIYNAHSFSVLLRGFAACRTEGLKKRNKTKKGDVIQANNIFNSPRSAFCRFDY